MHPGTRGLAADMTAAHASRAMESHRHPLRFRTTSLETKLGGSNYDNRIIHKLIAAQPGRGNQVHISIGTARRVTVQSNR